MSFRYGARSLAVRGTLQQHLVEIFDSVLQKHDHGLTGGARSPVDQQREFEEGDSQKRGINEDGSVADYPHAPRLNDGMPHPAGKSWAVDAWPWVKGKKLIVPSTEDILRFANQIDAEKQVKKALLAYMQFAYFIRLVLDVSEEYFSVLEQVTGERWALLSGADWNVDGDITDTGFLDAPHFQLVRLP